MLRSKELRGCRIKMHHGARRVKVRSQLARLKDQLIPAVVRDGL